ncbi:hypothetical protein AHiyo8_40370 [Arthrobacter sp. Hiyo8]|nr:hypothetical protein AHiyo8_40370 [Arthrobacter sp. Hiyo8]
MRPRMTCTSTDTRSSTTSPVTFRNFGWLRTSSTAKTILSSNRRARMAAAWLVGKLPHSAR